MATKYIVDNLSGQTIDGNITINGNLSVTGVTTGSLATYKALLTQTEPFTATTQTELLNSAFIIGETYTITNYVASDDFSNIANVQSGTINTTGCVFIATGETASLWINGSELVSSGNFVATVLENNLGYDISWSVFAPGVYFGYNETSGPIYNSFNRINTSSMIQMTTPLAPEPITFTTGVASLNDKDDIIYVFSYDYLNGNAVGDSLFYNPIQIDIKQDLDTTPINLNGTLNATFPFDYVSVNLECGVNYVDSFIGDSTTVNDINEMLNQLNTNPTTSYLGTYSVDGFGALILQMPNNLANQFCSNGTLTFYVFQD